MIAQNSEEGRRSDIRKSSMLVAAVKKSRKDQTYAASAATGSTAAAGARARSVSTATHC